MPVQAFSLHQLRHKHADNIQLAEQKVLGLHEEWHAKKKKRHIAGNTTVHRQAADFEPRRFYSMKPASFVEKAFATRRLILVRFYMSPSKFKV